MSQNVRFPVLNLCLPMSAYVLGQIRTRYPRHLELIWLDNSAGHRKEPVGHALALKVSGHAGLAEVKQPQGPEGQTQQSKSDRACSADNQR